MREVGWMGTLNDWFTNYGFGAFSVAEGDLSDGDVIRVMYITTPPSTTRAVTWAAPGANKNTTRKT